MRRRRPLADAVVPQRERMAEDRELHTVEKALVDKMGQHDAREPCVAELLGRFLRVHRMCVCLTACAGSRTLSGGADLIACMA